MGFFNNLLMPKDFDGKIEKLFNWYKNNTKFVSSNMLRDKFQLREAVASVALVLNKDVSTLSYDEIKSYGDVFTTILARAYLTANMGMRTLIANTPEEIKKRYSFIGSMNDAQKITEYLLDLVK